MPVKPALDALRPASILEQRAQSYPTARAPDGVPKENVRFACLTYHRVTDETDQYAVTQEQLCSHLDLFEREGFVAEDFEHFETRLHDSAPWPRRYAVLTFDDGHESNMPAADVLERHRCNATFFLTRDRCLNHPGFIRDTDIRDLRKRGFSVGTHGTTHRKMTRMSEQACIQELVDSKRWLEDVLGEEVRYMAAPGGYINSRVLRFAFECSYTLVGTCREWMNSPGDLNLPGTINRVNVKRHFSLDNFRRAICGSGSFYAWRVARSLTLALPKKFAS